MSLPQIPQTPGNLPPGVRQWFDAAAKMLRTVFGKGPSGVPTRQELADAGVVSIGSGGSVSPPSGTVTTPPKVTGLTAEGALASIFLNWDAPTFPNLAYVEVLRADTDDFGASFPVGTAVRGVNMYKDNVGSGATKFYWVRAVTTAGIKGPPNAASGTEGTTGYDPSYVMSILTSGQWQALTAYQPYQYVRPTAASNFQYVCIDGGTSGATEPTWPVIVGNTVTDGSCQWKCEELTARVPFAVGTVDGQPAVSILSAFIQDASITNAKVYSMAVDKLTAGTIAAISVELGGYLWSGFNTYANPSNLAGFWFGMNGASPAFKLSSGAGGGNKGIAFDGTNLLLTGDGYLDDVYGDTSRFNLASANVVTTVENGAPSDYITETSIPIDDPAYQGYLCILKEVCKTTSSATTTFTMKGYPRLSGTGPSIGASSPDTVLPGTGVYTDLTPANNYVLPYNESDNTNILRFKGENIAFRGMIAEMPPYMATHPDFGVGWGTDADSWFDDFTISLHFGDFITIDHQVDFDLMGSIQDLQNGLEITLTQASPYNSQNITCTFSRVADGLLVVCDDDLHGTGYSDGLGFSLKLEAYIKFKYYGVGGSGVTVNAGVGLQLWKKPIDPSQYATDAKFT